MGVAKGDTRSLDCLDYIVLPKAAWFVVFWAQAQMEPTSQFQLLKLKKYS